MPNELLDQCLAFLGQLTDPEELTRVATAAAYRAHELRSHEPKHGPEPGDCNDAWFIEQARDQYAKDGEVEVDDQAVVSRGAEDGAYVQAWVYVYSPGYADDDQCVRLEAR